jgi:hypothetical protein
MPQGIDRLFMCMGRRFMCSGQPCTLDKAEQRDAALNAEGEKSGHYIDTG